MKSHLLHLAIICLLSLACKKENNELSVEKKIDNTFLCTEKPLISQSDKVFVGLRYFKNYAEKDKVTLTLNGVSALEKGFRVDQLEGTNYYFEFPPQMNNGEVELILTIQNDQNTYTQKKKVRIIENYNLETVWDNLDNAYLLASFPFMYYHDINFGIFGNIVINGKPSQDKTITIGPYIPDGLIASTPAFKPFIPGLNGRYILTYNDQRILTQIKVLQGSSDYDPQITYEKLVNDVSQVYGPPISVEHDHMGNKITKLQYSKFHLEVYQAFNQDIYTIITLK